MENIFPSRTGRENFPAFWQKIFRRSWQNSILLVQKNFQCYEKISLKFCKKQLSFVILRHWAKVFRFFDEHFLAGLSKLHFMCPKKHLGEMFFLEKKIYSHLRTSSEQVSVFCRKNLEMSVIITFSVSRRTLWGQIIFRGKKLSAFSDIKLMLFHLLKKTIRLGLSNCILRAQTKVFGCEKVS